MSILPHSRWTVALLFIAGVLVGCSSEPRTEDASTSVTDTLTLETKGDSVAARMMEAHGATAFASAPHLRFNFAVETPKGRQVVARHFWDRDTGDYRVEWQSGPDSSYVALVDVRTVEDEVPAGEAYLNGQKLEGEASTEARRTAYGRFVNDTYWLLAPLKVFDPGVNRTYAPDSSTGDYHVLHLTFGEVGLTPGDEYWLYVSTETGRLDRWAYHLQGMKENAPPRRFHWMDYRTLQAPDGPVTLATRKEAVGQEAAILTSGLEFPSSPPSRVFSAPEPILASDESGN